MLQYESLYPPLDLSDYQTLTVKVFNTDQQSKSMRLAIATGPADADLVVLETRQNILPVLRWQSLTFTLNLSPQQLAAVRRLVFQIEDRKDKGVLYLDHINLVRPELS